jgi:hypothetical protein
MYPQIEDIRPGANASHDASSHSTIFHDILSCKLPKHDESLAWLKDEAQLLFAAGMQTYRLDIDTRYLPSSQKTPRT